MSTTKSRFILRVFLLILCKMGQTFQKILDWFAVVCTSKREMNRRPSVNADLIIQSTIGPVLGQVPNSSRPGNQQQLRVLNLTDDQHRDSALYRLEKGWILEFRLGSSLLGKRVSLYTNHPENFDEEFVRDKYRALEWQNEGGKTSTNAYSDDTAIYVHLPIRRAGSFRYYFVHSNGTEEKPNGSGYFIVDPVLPFGSNNSQVLPLDCIQCQTVLAKSLGPFKDWEGRLRVCMESGYNMIHFTPLQALGGSNSSYSLKDQLQLNPIFSSKDQTFDDIFAFTNKMRSDWKVLSLSDIVLNHTANESPWLQEHPEVTYNMETAPHLAAAAILDAALHLVTLDAAAGKLVGHGVPSEVYTADQINALKYYLNQEIVPRLHLEEIYLCDIEVLVSQFLELASQDEPYAIFNKPYQLKLIPDQRYRRNLSTVDFKIALKLYNVTRQDVNSEEERLAKCAEDFRRTLYKLNEEAREALKDHLSAAVDNTIAGIRYFRLQEDGPKLREVSERCPLVPRYFTGDFEDWETIDSVIYSDAGRFVMAHNGWVMNSDPLRNFAAADSNVYIRRELVAWGDSVKLRYGDKPSDSQFLWDHMQQYVEQTALIFDGIRLDNCHSTPLNVAEYLLDCARRVRPDLYVAAELFTNSDATDNIFVNRLGITSLIREAMSAWDSHELGRLVYRYGGEPAGSFYAAPRRPLEASIAHAMFLDVTHDNPSPVEKRSVFDLLPSAALVAMACSASGSSRGYDELVPHHIHVVDEVRLYPSWTSGSLKDRKSVVNATSGIIAAKKALNDLHYQLGEEGYSQVFVDQMNEDIVAVTRHNPQNHETMILVSYTAFRQPGPNVSDKPDVKNLRIEGQLAEVVLEARFLNKDTNNRFGPPGEFKKDADYINGLTNYEVFLQRNINIEDSKILKLANSGSENVLQFEFNIFQPGSVVVIRVLPHPTVKPNLEGLVALSKNLLSSSPDAELMEAVSELSLADLNHALYRCDQEEREDGMGAYNVPNFGSFVYCGIQGFVSVLSEIRPNNDLGHPVCNNLRQGDWMMDYLCGRLKKVAGTHKLGVWLEKQFDGLRRIPRYLIPRYFDVIITGVYSLLLTRTAFLMSRFVQEGSSLVRSLALGSVQCTGVIPSAPLPPMSPALQHDPAIQDEARVTMSAGLPHFTTGYMRSWGRDTFIAVRGLFLLTGRNEEARYHILGYAACLRHGLIPNLLDRGVNARFNCRDAVWWWLYSIVEYVKLVPEGANILQDPVSRIYPRDDSPALGPGVVDMPLCDVIHEALSVHFQGLSFRERNAGSQIDAHMQDPGFNNSIGVDLETGFVYGGNEHNCGTWMDKMGSSEKAGNKGKPATPRDGSAVEIVSLSKAVLRDLQIFYQKGLYPYGTVERFDRNGQVIVWTLKEWEDRIAANFDEKFWVPNDPQENEPRPDLVNRRGIFKDTVGATQAWADYQLRCNFPIAMVVAPEMIQPQRAWRALDIAEKSLLGPLGMKTLDPSDWNYRGDYHNDNDSGDIHVAHGWNYHQGPEWVWPVGFFLRARLNFAKSVGGLELLERTVSQTRSYLSHHYQELLTSPWRGLPELTNKDGAYCGDSCRTQAWSMGCVLEVMYDLDQLERELAERHTRSAY